MALDNIVQYMRGETNETGKRGIHGKGGIHNNNANFKDCPCHLRDIRWVVQIIICMIVLMHFIGGFGTSRRGFNYVSLWKTNPKLKINTQFRKKDP
jgi:hypothetical protein